MPLCQVDFSTKPSFWKALRPPAKDKVGFMTLKTKDSFKI